MSSNEAKTQWTPGPWLLDQHSLGVVDEYYHSIWAGAGMPATDERPGADGFHITGYMSAAEARLIAAAPELVEALEGLMQMRDAALRGEIVPEINEQEFIPKVRALLSRLKSPSAT